MERRTLLTIEDKFNFLNNELMKETKYCEESLEVFQKIIEVIKNFPSFFDKIVKKNKIPENLQIKIIFLHIFYILA